MSDLREQMAIKAAAEKGRQQGLLEAAKIADAWCEKNHWPNGVWGIAAEIREIAVKAALGEP